MTRAYARCLMSVAQTQSMSTQVIHAEHGPAVAARAGVGLWRQRGGILVGLALDRRYHGLHGLRRRRVARRWRLGSSPRSARAAIVRTRRWRRSRISRRRSSSSAYQCMDTTLPAARARADVRAPDSGAEAARTSAASQELATTRRRRWVDGVLRGRRQRAEHGVHRVSGSGRQGSARSNSALSSMTGRRTANASEKRQSLAATTCGAGQRCIVERATRVSLCAGSRPSGDRPCRGLCISSSPVTLPSPSSTLPLT